MQKTKLLVAVLGALCAMPALAADAPASPFTITSNVGVVSNYVFRGITQTAGAPAVQGGMDLAHTSGFYAGLWGSNVSWIADSGAVGSGSVTMELDTYLGYKASITDDVGYDVGYVRYNYLGSKYEAASGFALADTAEAYAAISYKFLTAKYSYSVLNQFLTVADEKGTDYFELNANYAIPETTYTVIGHAGKQTYKGTNASTATYSDYKVGVAKDISGYVVTLAYTSTDAKDGGFYTYATKGGNWARDMVSASLTHSF